MEERTPPSDFHALQLASPSRRETYVVQYPRDQVHRVPPPEHSRIIEEHIRTTNDPTQDDHRRKVLSIVGGVLLFILSIIIIMSILRNTAYVPEQPVFSITGIKAKNLEAYAKRGRPAPVYTVTLHARSPNPRMHGSYKGGRLVSLALDGYRIGKGKFPKSKATGAKADFKVAVTGNTPVEVEDLVMEPRTRKAMQLKTEVAVEMSSWARSDKWVLKVLCEFTVKDSLTSKKIKIWKQECVSESI